MPKYIVECLVQYRMVYCIDAPSKAVAEHQVWAGNVEEYGQDFLGEIVVSSREASDQECIRVFDEVNDYLTHLSPEDKLSRAFKVRSEVNDDATDSN